MNLFKPLSSAVGAVGKTVGNFNPLVGSIAGAASHALGDYAHQQTINERAAHWGAPIAPQAPQQASSPGDPNYGGVDQAGGGGGGTGYGYSYYDANTDPTLVAQNRNQAQDLINRMNAVYASLYGAIDRQTQDARSRLDSNYQSQFDNQDKQLQTSQDQTNNFFAGRGAANSSYNAVAQGNNVDAYTNERNALLQDREGNYAKLGQSASTARNKLGQSRPSVDLGQYNDVASLTDLRNQLDAHIKGLESQQANEFGTTGDYVNSLNKIAPAQSNLQGQLADKLSKLAQSSAPDSAKASIAKGYIKLAGADENYWQNYFLNLLNPVQAPTQQVV